jgi:hypothetical protein
VLINLQEGECGGIQKNNIREVEELLTEIQDKGMDKNSLRN